MNTQQLENTQAKSLQELLQNLQKLQQFQQFQQKLALLLKGQSEDDQKPKSRLCQCCVEQPQKHFKSIPISQQANEHPFNCFGKLIVYSPDHQNSENPIKQTQTTGFLISNGIVMTAASCIVSWQDLKQGMPKSSIFFQMVNKKQQIKRYKVSLWVIHQEFIKYEVNSQNFHYDIALLFLEDKQALGFNRKLKLLSSYNIDVDKEKIHIITCPSNSTDLYQRHQTKAEDHIQLMNKFPLNTNHFSCQKHKIQRILTGFEGCPLLREITNDKGEINYEVALLFKNYSMLERNRGIGFILKEKNDIIQICRLINKIEDIKTKKSETIIQELVQYSNQLLVFQCSDL